MGVTPPNNQHWRKHYNAIKALKNTNQATNLSNKKIKLLQDVPGHIIYTKCGYWTFTQKMRSTILKGGIRPSFDQLNTMYAWQNYINKGKPDSAIHYRNKEARSEN